MDEWNAAWEASATWCEENNLTPKSAIAHWPRRQGSDWIMGRLLLTATED